MVRCSPPALFTIWILSGCGGADEPSQERKPPAEVKNPVTEADLTTVRLTPSAEKRIGIRLGKVERKSVRRTRWLGGELISPPGAAVQVKAPKAAIILPPESGEIPKVGTKVTQTQAVLRIIVLLPEGDLARARQEVDVVEARLDNARARARRADELVGEGVGTEEASLNAREDLLSAEAALRTARAQLELMTTGRAQPDSQDLTPITLTAPQSGVIRRVLVAAGQTVPEGTLLLEIVRLDPLWVRVPVYVGDISTIDPQAEAWVTGPGGPGDGEPRSAKPLAAVPIADPASSSADLFYEVPNPRESRRPGERVGVTLSLRGDQEQLVVPSSAIVHDIYGGTWIYESLGDHVYFRRRVEVRDVLDEVAILTKGAAAGTTVVVVGAAELFGTEFGPSK